MTKRFREFLHITPLTRWKRVPGVRSLLATAAVIAGIAFVQAGSLADDIPPSIRIETLKTHSRLSFHVDDGVHSEWKSDGQGFELFLKGIGLADLGAPLGEEAKWVSQFKNLNDPRLQSIEFAEAAGGLRVQGKWKYAQGGDAPANPQMETFDYRERARSELVVDFWVKEGPSVAQVKTKHAVTRKLASIKKHQDDEKARAERLEAREKARALAEDPKLFCRTPLSTQSDVFLRFHPVHEAFGFDRWFATTAPDTDFPYYEPKGKAKDASYARLALKLYRDGKFALVNRTIDFFDQECPDSSFRSQMRFLRANALLKLGMTEEGLRLLREIQHEPQVTPQTLHAGMYLAMQQFEKENYLGALESFLWLSTHQAQSRYAWIFHMGAAECSRRLQQTDRAAKEYQWVAENAPDAFTQSEGALRLGDLYLDRFQYDQALAAYAQAMKHFEKEAASFPAIHINRADSLYGLGQYERAAEAYRRFLEQFPEHPSGWRAAYRLGEIEGRKATATRESSDAHKWYLETINRFPFSPGATLARLQLLPCGDHGGFNAEAAKRFFETEAEKFDGGGEIAMDRYKDLRALARVRSLMTLGQQELAVSIAIEELRRVPKPEARRWLSHLLAFNFRKSVMELLDKGEKLAALTFYQKNEDTVPLTDGAVDPDYLLKLSQAASDLALGKLAQEINGAFEKARKVREGATRTVASDSQTSNDPDLKLEASERAFTQAKALWIGNGMKSEDVIRVLLGHVAPESRFSQQREIILGLMEEKAKRPMSALRHAVQAQLLGPRDGRIDAWVAELEARAGDSKAAFRAFRAIEQELVAADTAAKAQKDEDEDADESQPPMKPAELLGVAPVPGREALILAQSEILEKQAHWGEAAANYSRAVEKGLGGAQARYNYARALLKAGGKDNHAKAIATLEKLAAEDAPPPKAGGAPQAAAAPAQAAGAGTDADRAPAAAKGSSSQDKFWRKLASETLANEKTENGAKEGMKP